MSLIVKEVQVKGFQGYRQISVPMWDDVNFIIGRNGSGKTSFVRLLYASLNLDASELAQGQFQSLTVKFRNTESKRVPVLTIEKDTSRSNVLDIRFRPHSKAPITRYYVDEDDSESGRFRVTERNILAELLSRQNSISENIRPLSELRRTLRRNLQFSWLPLLRSRGVARRASEYYAADFADEPINRKIKELLSQITSFLAVLDTRVSEANKKFQRSVFVSYIRQGLFDVRALQRLNMRTEQSELLRMLNEMEYPISDIEGAIESFFQGAEQTKGSVIPGQPSLIKIDQIFLFDLGVQP